MSDVLSPIRSPPAVGIVSEIGTPLVTAVPDALLLCNMEMPSQTQPETDFSPQVCVACPDVGLLASKVSPDITNGSREEPFGTHHDRHGSPVSPRLLQETQGCLFRMTSYDAESDGPNFSPEHGVQLTDPRKG